ncbi:MAG: hypothetical protein QXR45_08475 [Candidatus Bathyarchaeia archaeon]
MALINGHIFYRIPFIILSIILRVIAAAIFRFGGTIFPNRWSINLIVAILLGGTFYGFSFPILNLFLGQNLAIPIERILFYLVLSYINTIVAAIAYGIVSKARLL